MGAYVAALLQAILLDLSKKMVIIDWGPESKSEYTCDIHDCSIEVENN